MDFSFTPNGSSSNPPHNPPFSSNPPPDPPPPPVPHPRRHTRYSAAHPNVSPPHVVINTRRRRSPHRRAPPQNGMSASPPAAQGSSHTSASLGSVPQPPLPQGTSHNAMETDDESDHYDESEGEDDEEDEDTEDHPEEEQPPYGVDAGTQMEASLMDTSPDNPAVPLEEPPPPVNDQAGQATPAPVMHIADDATALTSVTPTNSWGGAIPPVTPGGGAQIQLQVDAELLALEAAPRRSETPHEGTSPLRERTDLARMAVRRDENRDDDDDGSDSDESMDEPDHPYWAHFKPDTSVPDENEITAMEGADELNATDHAHWEKSTFEPVDDPEYVPSDVGRISWTLEGVHGTPEKPNREEVMRSPSVLIGDLFWNVKFYPRGNDGTDYMSVYIECSPKPYEENIEKRKKSKDRPVDDKSDEKIPVEENSANELTEDDGLADGIEIVGGPPPPGPVNGAEHPYIPEVDMEASVVLPSDSVLIEEVEEIIEERPWSVAAQVACVIYNPEEPRTWAAQKSKHQYYNDNPDWGWTRFHGPWSETHMRRHYQRRPLLQNDTLAFTVYIQVIQDQTKSLWWHPSDSRPNWDSMSLLGLRGLRCKEHHVSAMVAAVSAWMHLGCVVEKVHSIKIPNKVTKLGEQLLPALKEFQHVMRKEGLIPESSDVSLSTLSQIISFFYGTDMDVRKDVVMVWSALRRVLNLEATLNSKEAGGNAVDLFSDIAMLKQPDPIDSLSAKDLCAKFPTQFHTSSTSSSTAEPASVQEAIDAAFQDPTKAFRLWHEPEKEEQTMLDMPTVLQIELARQAYNKDARKWKKLTHRIALDENIICNNQRYTLYGMIVHSGGLEYHEYYSVLRPDGPGTKWLKYAGETSSNRSVEVLTRKQAVANHEGGDSQSESAAVAYVAIYVRTDRLRQVLSTSHRKEILHEAEEFDSQPISTETEKHPNSRLVFRVGKRDWSSAFELDHIYDTIRGVSHLSRTFYRTEGPTSTLGQFPVITAEVALDGVRQLKALEDSEKLEDGAQKNTTEGTIKEFITVFVKQFDILTQQYTNRGAFKMNPAMNVNDFLREQLWVEKDEKWDFYHEHSILIKAKHLIRRTAQFYDLSYGETLWDGVVIVAQRRPTPEQIKAAEDAGKCLNPVEYSYYLLGDHNPVFYAPHLTNSYFTNPYLSVPLSHGRAHGQGTHIALSGSAYTGPYRCGRKSGPNGTMHYANGDTYTGDWDHDEPHGQGTMTYAKTGNVYTGGWKKRLRFGAGVMNYKVADQQMMLCGVCYEKNMDAVFCFCGHVVACEECARKVDTCPVCRETVKKVVVLKGATGGSGAPSEWAGGKEGGGDVGMIP